VLRRASEDGSRRSINPSELGACCGSRTERGGRSRPEHGAAKRRILTYQRAGGRRRPLRPPRMPGGYSQQALGPELWGVKAESGAARTNISDDRLAVLAPQWRVGRP